MAVERRDIAAVGRAMYEELRPELEASHWGRMVVIDVDTGDYEVGDDDVITTLRLLEQNPEAVTRGERVGYPAPYHASRRITFTPYD